MPLDAICLAAVRNELSGQITGAKIDKVLQPERDLIILSLRGAGYTRRLLISAGSNDARVHINEYQFENPASPPMFCMLLRKHLSGARITAVEQLPAERVLTISIDAVDAIGVASKKQLILELMGRFSNIILTDSDGIIIDCLHRVGGDISEKRSILPGLIYRQPPEQAGKRNPLTAGEDEWRDLFAGTQTSSADKWLLSSFSALSPLICRELSVRAYGEPDFRMDSITDGGAALRREFFALMDDANAGRFEPVMLTDAEGAARDFSYTRITQYNGLYNLEQCESFSDMLETFYTRTAQLARVKQRSSAMTKSVKNARDRLLRKLETQRLELNQTKDRDSLRECGDLITANLHQMQKGQHLLEAQDFYSENGGIRAIKLDPLKTPQQNAAKYYKDYTKMRNAERYLSEQISSGESELIYLESVLEELAFAEGERDLLDIRRELEQTGVLKNRYHGKMQKRAESQPRRFLSSGGFTIYAGRNNMQNDILTFKTALKTDIWLHAKNIHGSHVIISCGGAEPDETTLQEAAEIAAWYSQARGQQDAIRAQSKVAVDYCRVKFVKKPPGGRPGAVIYSEFKTIIVSPDEKIVKLEQK